GAGVGARRIDHRPARRSRRHLDRAPCGSRRRVAVDPRRSAGAQPATRAPRHARRRARVPVLRLPAHLTRVRMHADNRADDATGEVRGARAVLAVLVAAWIVVLALYLRHAIVLSSDSVNNHVHVWYIARDLWHHGRLPWH